MYRQYSERSDGLAIQSESPERYGFTLAMPLTTVCDTYALSDCGTVRAERQTPV